MPGDVASCLNTCYPGRFFYKLNSELTYNLTWELCPIVRRLRIPLTCQLVIPIWLLKIINSQAFCNKWWYWGIIVILYIDISHSLFIYINFLCHMCIAICIMQIMSDTFLIELCIIHGLVCSNSGSLVMKTPLTLAWLGYFSFNVNCRAVAWICRNFLSVHPKTSTLYKPVKYNTYPLFPFYVINTIHIIFH